MDGNGRAKPCLTSGGRAEKEVQLRRPDRRSTSGVTLLGLQHLPVDVNDLFGRDFRLAFVGQKTIDFLLNIR